ncbi:MAG: response regulator [Proteobacteria bacterium]|nr:response regulator [Pseudomonadota bacterium]MBU1696300.1 response regulator [Pseudomonadota bacterium]
MPILTKSPNRVIWPADYQFFLIIFPYWDINNRHSLGYKVQTATTPQDALDRFALNPHHFDLVITDMTMPQMTGVNLSEQIVLCQDKINTCIVSHLGILLRLNLR